jgi:hypothetical protein
MSLSEAETLLWDNSNPISLMPGNIMRSTASSRFAVLMSASAVVFALATAPFYASQAVGESFNGARGDHDLRLANLVAEARIHAVSIDGP